MKWNLLWLLAVSLGITSCMDQYNPRPYWKQFTEERQVTSHHNAKLTDKGELPPKEVASAAATDPASQKFSSLRPR